MRHLAAPIAAVTRGCVPLENVLITPSMLKSIVASGLMEQSVTVP
jgi:hypothetical protein